MKTNCLESRIQNIIFEFETLFSKKAQNKSKTMIIYLSFHIMFLYFFTKEIRFKHDIALMYGLFTMVPHFLYASHISITTDKFYFLIFMVPCLTFNIFLMSAYGVNLRKFTANTVRVLNFIFSIYLCMQILFFNSRVCFLKKEGFFFTESFYNKFC